MKNTTVILGLALSFLVAGCATTPVALAPVGPNPSGSADLNSSGGLEVFSALVERTGGNERNFPVWYQHTDYYLYNQQGGLVNRVDNTVGYYARAPRVVSLPAGTYVLKARSKDYFWVKIPVVIEHGRITRVHLDDAWQPPADTPRTLLVQAPGGQPVGWRTDAAKASSSN